MTRKEEDKLLLDKLGLKVGDVIRVEPLCPKDRWEVVKIVEDDDKYMLKFVGGYYLAFDGRKALGYYVGLLEHRKFEKTKLKEKMGDDHCGELMCSWCPLRYLSDCRKSKNREEEKLFEILERFKNDESYNLCYEKLNERKNYD